MKENVKRLLFFWLISFVLATTGYYFIWLIMPNHHVFGKWIRMILYHEEYPLQYISIPCFFYGIFATFYLDKFKLQTSKMQVFSILVMVFLVLVFSAPFGGMLWVFHDMQAGFFPANWLKTMILEGILMGFGIGWVIILGSIPYNILGVIVAYFLTKKGAKIFK